MRLARTLGAVWPASRRTATPALGQRTVRHARGNLAAAVVVAVLLASVLAGCRTVIPPDPALVTALSGDLGQLLLVGFRGTDADADEDLERLVCRASVGGLLLFGRNVVDTGQVAHLTARIRERARQCGDRRLLITVDAEGGQVMRLGPAAGYTPTLSAEALGAGNDLALTELEARRIGRMLRAAGINWNLAPVVDVGYNPANPVIVGPGRSFSANPRLVAAQAGAWIRGMHAAGILTALKHFPGHGSSFADSHHGFVDVTETADPDLELPPYRALIAQGLADSIMTAHVFNRRLDPHHPATLSAPTVTGLLRERLGFTGLVVSDDLRMGAIEEAYRMDHAALLALLAGVDMVLIADDRLPDGRSGAEVALTTLRQALADGRLPLDRAASALARVRALQTRRPSE